MMSDYEDDQIGPGSWGNRERKQPSGAPLAYTASLNRFGC